MKDPQYRAVMTNEMEVRRELMLKRRALEARLASAQAANDAAEAGSLSNRLVEIEVALDDVRRHMMAEVRRHMTNAVPRGAK